MQPLHFITGSIDKFKEAQSILKNIQRVDIDLPELQEVDQKFILEAKLQAAAAQGYENIIVEDTGLYFESLNYALPGPLIKWFVRSIGNQGLTDLATLGGKGSGAYALTTIGYLCSRHSQPIFCEGRLDGSIGEARGSGFGWDAIFTPTGLSQSLGEMSLEIKTKLSHRGKAFSALAAVLSARKAI